MPIGPHLVIVTYLYTGGRDNLLIRSSNYSHLQLCLRDKFGVQYANAKWHRHRTTGLLITESHIFTGIANKKVMTLCIWSLHKVWMCQFHDNFYSKCVCKTKGSLAYFLFLWPSVVGFTCFCYIVICKMLPTPLFLFSSQPRTVPGVLWKVNALSCIFAAVVEQAGIGYQQVSQSQL